MQKNKLLPVFIAVLLCSTGSLAQQAINYVRTWDARIPITDAATMAGRPVSEVLQTTAYIDGLGRPLQTVARQASLATGTNTSADLVSTYEYDPFGREVKKYLPYASSSTSGNIKSTPLTEQNYFYNTQLSGQGESNFYSLSDVENSPLNRTVKSYAPGISWVGSGRGNAVQYVNNTSADNVRMITVNGPGSYTVGDAYGDGQLIETHSIDEHNKQVVEYKDKEGKLVLKKVQLDNVVDDSYTGWLCTYYVYDIYNNLRLVIQPEGVKKLVSPTINWQFNTTILDEQCFRYEYDNQNRMIIKKVPGAGEVYMVYDPWDRLVLTQDANQRIANQYLLTKYDAFNRPVLTGLYTTGSTIQDVRTAAQNNAAYSFEARVATSGNYGYTSQCWPTSNYDVLTATYYDNYTWLGPNGNVYSQTPYTGDYGLFSTAYSIYPYPQPLTQSLQVNGLVTGTMVKVLGTSQYLYSINYYDDKGRVIQNQAQQISGFNTTVTTQYNFSGQPLATYHLAGNGIKAQGDLTNYEYDDLGRLLTARKTLYTSYGAGNTGQKIIAQNEYDALGQLTKKKLAPAYNGNLGLETENFDYNIRGWLLGMNRDYIKNTDEGGYNKHYFSFELGYDKASNSSGANFYHSLQYNGNITGMVWKSAGDEVRRKYDFNYDAANRLGTADFTQNTKTTWGGNFTNTEMDFSVYGDNPANNWFMKYDDNGNILSMVQRGFRLGIAPSQPIDQLSYSYQPNSNKLLGVTDAYNDKDSKLGDFKYDPATKTAVDYSYDDNGNLTTDKNKSISTITYNHLNLPAVITVTGKGTITYTYDAAGNKLKKVTQEDGATVPYNGSSYTTSIITTTTYIGGAVYEAKTYSNTALASLGYSDKLQFIAMEEGRIRWQETIPPSGGGGAFQYDYMLKDHLGNVRMVLTEEQKVDQYPAATMETAQIATEELLYGNLNETQHDKPVGYPTDNTTTPNDRVAAVNGSGYKIGPSLTLKVMAGDKFTVKVSSWYRLNGNPIGSPANQLPDLLTALLGGVGGVAVGSHGVTSGNLLSSGALVPGATEFLTTQNNTSTTAKPQAFLNWILFDEQFKMVSSSSGFDQVGADQEFKLHTKTDLPIDKNGYLYIYVSNNTTNLDVFFDNLQVTHTRGAILEETHYYPFGLMMAGISSKAAGEMTNKDKTFQGQKFDDDLDLNWVQFKYRNHDPQIGRFIELDPLAEKYPHNSTYAFSENKVTSNFEVEGLEASAEFNVERDLRDVSSGKISLEQLDARVSARGTATAIGGGAGIALVLSCMYPQAAQVFYASMISGIPLNGAPQMVVESTVATVGSEGATASSEVVVSMADKARVLTAGGEIGLMDGAANLAVDGKTGLFNITLQSGKETAKVAGEISIKDNAIGFTNLEITNAKGGLGSIEQQNSVGSEAFLKLFKTELTELSQAGGFQKGTLEFSRMRPPGSKLPDSESRTITLFDTTPKQ